MILVGGIRDDPSEMVPICEIYDSVNDTIRETAPVPKPTTGHTATLLVDGRLLVTGGFWPGGATVDERYVDRCALYDPQSETWTLAAPLRTRRSLHGSVLLTDGRVLVVGGKYGTSSGSQIYPQDSQIYDPGLDAWTVGPMLVTPRKCHTCTMLQDGRMIVVGGVDSKGQHLRSVEILGPSFP
jgi:hypothetical protein